MKRQQKPGKISVVDFSKKREVSNFFFLFGVSLQSVIHVQFCKTYIYLLQIKGKGETTKRSMEQIHVKSLRGAKVLQKLVSQRRRTELEGVPDSGNGDAPIDSAKNCLKQDLSDFTPVLVMGES